MEKKEVVWTLPAKNDLKHIYDYISDVSEVIAERIIQKILSRTRLLEKGFTKIGQQEPLLRYRNNNYHYLVEGNYKIIYNEQDDKIIIHTVFDSRQNPERMKKIVKE